MPHLCASVHCVDATKGTSVHHHLRHVIAAFGVLLLHSAAAVAQTTVTMPDTSQTTTVSVTVTEQARINVPPGISFNVTNVAAGTSAAAAAVVIDQIVLGSATKQLRLSLRANAASFTPPVVGAATWGAGDVSWNAASWTAAAGLTGMLDQSTYNTVATCNAGATSCSTSSLVFVLAPKPSVQRSGAHTLVVTWKVESIGS